MSATQAFFAKPDHNCSSPVIALQRRQEFDSWSGLSSPHPTASVTVRAETRSSQLLCCFPMPACQHAARWDITAGACNATRTRVLQVKDVFLSIEPVQCRYRSPPTASKCRSGWCVVDKLLHLYLNIANSWSISRGSRIVALGRIISILSDRGEWTDSDVFPSRGSQHTSSEFKNIGDVSFFAFFPKASY